MKQGKKLLILPAVAVLLGMGSAYIFRSIPVHFPAAY